MLAIHPDRYSTEARKIPRGISLRYDRLIYSDSGLLQIHKIGFTLISLTDRTDDYTPVLHIPDTREIAELGLDDLYLKGGTAIRSDIQDVSVLPHAAVESVLRLCDEAVGNYELPVGVVLRHIDHELMTPDESNAVHDTHSQVIAAMSLRFGDISPDDIGGHDHLGD